MAINHKTNHHHHHVTATRPHCMLMQRARTREAQEDAISLISSAPHQRRTLRFQQRMPPKWSSSHRYKTERFGRKKGNGFAWFAVTRLYNCCIYIRDKLPEAYRLRKWRKANADRVSKFPWRV